MGLSAFDFRNLSQLKCEMIVNMEGSQWKKRPPTHSEHGLGVLVLAQILL